MPHIEGKAFCRNHPDKQMSRHAEYFAIIKVNKDKEKVLFNASSGIPLVVFICDLCGYMEFYPAVMFREWHEGHLYVKCKGCSVEFPSPIQMDRASFESAVLVSNKFQCPHCKNINSYDKGDMFFK